jgi:uncharacterized protein YodC (DUF2158 family)
MGSDTFKAGDIVELKSGGPPMTIVEVNSNLAGHVEIVCTWFFGKIETASFAPGVLTPSKPRDFEELKGAFSTAGPYAPNVPSGEENKGKDG